MELIIRNDDVSQNTDMFNLFRCYGVINDLYPKAEIWSCITILSKHTDKGSVYPNVPFKDNPVKWFWDVNQVWTPDIFITGISKVASHGLFHINHAKLNKDMQEMSIVSSCKYLNTTIFVPPFNRSDRFTEEICEENGIQLINSDWKNIEKHPFDPRHKHWYFHSWRVTPEILKKVLTLKIRTKR